MAKLLLVDADQRHLRDLAKLLRGDGHDVHTIADGRQVIPFTYRLRPDIVLLAATPPSLDGIDMCRQLRQEPTSTVANRVPIILIGDRTDPVDCIVGLEVGADDYVTRPINRRELGARIKALIRRAAHNCAHDLPDERLQAGDLMVDTALRLATRNGEALQLHLREFDLLVYFLRYPKQILPRERLLRWVWGHGVADDTRSLDVHIHWLRSKIEPDPTNPIRIQTRRGVGYFFAG